MMNAKKILYMMAALALGIVIAFQRSGKSELERIFGIVLQDGTLIEKEAAHGSWDEAYIFYYARIKGTEATFEQLKSHFGLENSKGYEGGILTGGFRENYEWWNPPDIRTQLALPLRAHRWIETQPSNHLYEGQIVAQYSQGTIWFNFRGYPWQANIK